MILNYLRVSAFGQVISDPPTDAPSNKLHSE